MVGIIFKECPIRGIDISQYNDRLDTPKTIDFNKAKEGGVDYVVIRTSYGVVTDKSFRNSWADSKGILPRRPYHYLDYYSHLFMGISDTEWGKRQARAVWELIKDDNDGSIVWLDVESASVAPKIETLMPRVISIMGAFFSEMDKLNGKTNGLYSAASYLQYFYKKFGNRPLWIAWYNESKTKESILNFVKSTGWTGKVYDWQYTSDGDINGDSIGDGIVLGMEEKRLDLNMCLLSEEEFRNSFSVVVEEPPVVVPPIVVLPSTTKLVKVMTVTVGSLRIRTLPSLKGTITDYLPKDQEVEVLEEINDWARIGYKQYCSMSYLK